MSEFNVGDKVYLKCEVKEKYVNDNTYILNYKNWLKAEYTTALVEDDVLRSTDESYNKGLNDAWELAKKIVGSLDNGGYTANELVKIFGKYTYSSAISDFTPQEALAKVKAYEERNEIKVGDEIKLKNGKLGIVTYVDETSVSALLKDGRGVAFCVEFCSKTGKHYDIESILNGLKEED